MESRRSAPIVPALILIVIGLWFLFQNLNVPFFNLDVVWPVFPVVFGLVLLVRYIGSGRANPDDLGGAVFLTLVGFFFFGWYNLNLFNQDWQAAWPVFPLLIGVSNGITWLFHWRRWGNLLIAFAGFAFAAGGFAYTREIISADLALRLVQLWPVFVILAGLGFLLQGLLSRNSQ